MARIDTIEDTYITDVTLSEQLMGEVSGSFSIPVSHDLVQRGALDPWQPLRVNLLDGGDTPLAFPAYVTKRSIGAGEDLTVMFAGAEVALANVHLQSSDIGFSGSTDAAEVATRVIAYLGRTKETRRAGYSAAIVNRDVGQQDHETRWRYWELHPLDDSIRVNWTQFAADGSPATYARGKSAISSTSSTLRRLRLARYAFTKTTAITKATLKIRHRVSSGLNWSNSVRLIDLSTGTFWDENSTVATYDLPSPLNFTDTEIDITSDVTGVWTNVDDVNGDGGIGFDFILQASSASDTKFWDIADVLLTLHFDTTYSEWPIVPGTVETSGISVSPPSSSQLMSVRDWLDWCAEQGQLEWRVTDDPLVIGGAYVDIGPTVGSPVTFGSYEDGGNVQRLGADEDGLQQFSVVRVTTQANPNFDLVDDPATFKRIGHREYVHVYDRKGSPSTTLAEELLQELKQSSLPFRVRVPRSADLWSGIRVGDTVHLGLTHAPVRRWEGTVRLIQRNVDDAGSVADCVLLPMVGVLGTVDDERPPVSINRTTRRVRETRGMALKRRLHQMLRAGFRDNYSS